MHINPQLDSKNNIFIPERKKKTFRLNRILNIPYYVIVDHLFRKYGSVTSQTVILKTFAKVDQSLYEPGV